MVRTRVVVVFEMYWLLPHGTCLLSHFTMSEREKLGDSFDPVLRVHLSYLTNFTLSQFCSPQTMLLSIFLQHRDLSPASYVCVSILWASLGSSSRLHTVCTLPVITMAFYLLFPCVCVYKHTSMCCTCAHFACLLDMTLSVDKFLASLYPGSFLLSLFLSKLTHEAKMWKPYKNHVLFMCLLEAG